MPIVDWRALANATALWAFGLATTIVLVSVWGRAVAADEVTLAESADAVLASGYVDERVESWVGDALAAATAVSPDRTGAVVERVLATSEFATARAEVVDQLVAAALDPTSGTVTIEPADAFSGVVDVTVEALAAEGVAVEPAVVATGLAALPPVTLDEVGLGGLDGGVAGTRTFLTRAFLAGLAMVAAAAAAAVATSRQRTRQVRDLATRVALSGVSFAIFLRVGAWATDPAAGRSPVAAGGSVLLGSNGHVPLWVAGVATGVALVAAVAVRRRRSPSRPAPASERPLEPVG
ncbi:MAG: hypothetical protein AB1Z57_00115 [Acidimicrobiia bacterium]